MIKKILYGKKQNTRFKTKVVKKCEEHKQCFDKLSEALEKNYYSLNDEISELSRERNCLWDEVKQTLEDYHKACNEYLHDVLSTTDPPMTDFLRNAFECWCFNTNDWDNAITNLDSQVLMIKQLS